MQAVMIESSINSVRISIKIKQMNEIEKMLCEHFCKFMTRRADNFRVLRRKPVGEYDISFLITNIHLETMIKDKLIDFICTFIEDIDKEIGGDMRLAINARANACAKNFLEKF